MSEEAIQAEAEGAETATVRWRNLTPFEVPRYRMDWPFAAVVAAEQEQWPTFLHELLPDRTLAEFRSLRPTQRDAMDLLNAVSDALGFADSGESPASAK